jgi:hypothetical protein
MIASDSFGRFGRFGQANSNICFEIISDGSDGSDRQSQTFALRFCESRTPRTEVRTRFLERLSVEYPLCLLDLPVFRTVRTGNIPNKLCGRVIEGNTHQIHSIGKSPSEVAEPVRAKFNKINTE